MLKKFLIAAAILVPQVAGAADLPYRPHHVWHRHSHYTRYERRVYANDHVIRCTTSNWVLFSSSTCDGGGFDPLGVAGI